MRRLILASASPYRRALLERLRLPFEARSADLDEAAGPGESPAALVERLAQAKARAVVRAGEDALVIGSDQCAVLGETVLGKPGDAERARAQLAACSGRTVEFLTGLCVLDTADDRSALRVVPYRVRFSALTAAQIEAYVALEQPYDCAGSFKAEGLGSALFQSLEGSDPTALIGLPLIELCALLEAFGLPVLERRPD